MAKERGKNVLLYIATGGSPQSYIKFPGQRSTRIQVGTDVIDTSDKDSDNWKARLNGEKDIQITCSGVAVWPGTNDVLAVLSQHNQDLPVDAKAVLNLAGDYYEASFVVSNME